MLGFPDRVNLKVFAIDGAEGTDGGLLRTKHDDKVSFLQTFETSELAARYINEHFAEVERNQFQIVCIDYKRFAEEWKVEHALAACRTNDLHCESSKAGMRR